MSKKKNILAKIDCRNKKFFKLLDLLLVIMLTNCYYFSYNVERLFRGPPSPNRPSTEEIRQQRMLKEMLESEEHSSLPPLSEKTFVPKTVFEKNVSPSLVEEK